MLLDLAHLDAAFPAPDEAVESAIARARPLSGILVDGRHGPHRSELLLARARQVRVPLTFFGPAADRDGARWAAEHELRYLGLPADPETVGRLLDGVARSERRRPESDRRAPATGRAIDGTLVLDDADGKRWYVYDRRGGDRRGGASEQYRAFIREDGIERRCRLHPEEFRERTAEALGRQLARAASA